MIRLFASAIIAVFASSFSVFAEDRDELAVAIGVYEEARLSGTIHELKDSAVAIHDIIEAGSIPENIQTIFYNTSVKLIDRGDYLDDARAMIATLKAAPNRMAHIEGQHLEFLLSLAKWYEDPSNKTRKAVSKQVKAMRKVPPTSQIFKPLYNFVKEDDEDDKLRIRIREDAAEVFESYKNTFPNEWAELAYLASFAKAVRSGNAKWTKDVADIEAFLGRRLALSAEIDGDTEDLYLAVKQGRVSLQRYFSGNRISYNSTTTRRGSFERGVPAETISKIFASYDYDPDAVQALLDE